MRHLKGQQRGFSLIELLIVVAIIGIIASIASPNLITARRAANEGSAIGSMRTLNAAEATYLNVNGGNLGYGTRAQLQTAGLIDAVLGGGTKSGYTFATANVIASGAGVSAQYELTATPLSAISGSRSFYSDEAAVIYTLTGAAAGTRAAPGAPIQ